MHALQFPGCSPWPLTQGYGHRERIFDVAFHPLSDDIVLTASEDTSLRLWRRSDGADMYKQVRAYFGHTGEALRACWSANGLLLASGSADRTVRLWAADLQAPEYTGRQLAVLDGHPEEVYHVELFNPTAPPPSPALLHTLRQWYGGGGGGGGAGQAADQQQQQQLPPPLPPFETHVLAASSESLFVWSLQEGAVLQQANAPGTSGSTITQEAIMSGSAKPAYIFAVSRQPGSNTGSLLAAACCDGVVRLWSVRPTGHLEWAGQVKLPGAPMCTGCAFAADGARLGVTTREGRLVELDVRTLEVLTSRLLPSSPLSVAYLPAGPLPTASAAAGEEEGQREMWLVACRDGAVYGYELEQQGGGPACVVQPPSGTGVAVLAVAVSPGGAALALGGEPQHVARLPPMRTKQEQQQQPQSRPEQQGTSSAPQATSSSTNGGTIGHGAHAGSTCTPPPLQPATTGAATGASRGTASPATQAAAPAAAAAAAVAAPARRRGGGGGGGSRGAVLSGGGAALRNPLGLLEEAEADAGAPAGPQRQQTASTMQAPPQGSEEPSVAGGIAGLSLQEGERRGDQAGQAQSQTQPQEGQRQQQQGHGHAGGQVEQGVQITEAGQTKQRQREPQGEGHSSAGTKTAAAEQGSGNVRAGLFVYLAPGQ
ncbi:hypothetical protein Agub_g2345 [Astrephomene gubernaculifera]|uniref:Uncharacterized protein n=1 Tax=Astrephomene gubernaculifera TaxID=47775 RepID=A0AAD3DGZ1_9CHLO|nr:hypothetical protein Agub_g2345 [Astrephomene gubernaculifera]